MALYISAGRRRRTAIIAAVVALLIGLAAGFLVGRGTATTIDDTVTAARDAGRKFSSSLRVLPLEYEKVATANGGSTKEAADIIRRSLADEQATLDTAPWLSDDAISSVKTALDALRQAPTTDLPPADFDAAVDTAAAAVEQAFGIARTESPS
jgi:hypothetical protein